jgi:hypothetical protein
MDTNLDDGDTQVVCSNDLMMYGLSLAAATTSGMTSEQAEAYSELLDAIYANDPRAPKPPPARGGRRRQNAQPPDVPLDDAESHADGSVALPAPCTQCGGKTATGDAEKLTCDGCGTVLATADQTAG